MTHKTNNVIDKPDSYTGKPVGAETCQRGVYKDSNLDLISPLESLNDKAADIWRGDEPVLDKLEYIVKMVRVETAKQILAAGEHNCMTGSSTEGEMKHECNSIINEEE